MIHPRNQTANERTRRILEELDTVREVLLAASLTGDDIHAEINLSANMVADLIRRLLITFKIPAERLQLFLRQDRDAGRDGHAA